MFHFVKCSKPKVTWKGVPLDNYPVNLALCTQLQNTFHSWFEGTTNQPVIVFKGCDARWFFETVADRDAELERLLAIHSPPRADAEAQAT